MMLHRCFSHSILHKLQRSGYKRMRQGIGFQELIACSLLSYGTIRPSGCNGRGERAREGEREREIRNSCLCTPGSNSFRPEQGPRRRTNADREGIGLRVKGLSGPHTPCKQASQQEIRNASERQSRDGQSICSSSFHDPQWTAMPVCHEATLKVTTATALTGTSGTAREIRICRCTEFGTTQTSS